MRKFIITWFSLIAISLMAQQKVAIYITGDKTIGTVLENRLVADIAKTNQYIVVERTSNFIAELQNEHQYERTGFVDDDQISELGRQFGVQYVCVASVDTVWDNEKYLRAHLIDVESAEIIASTSSDGTINASSEELIAGLNTISQGLLAALQTNKQNASKKVAVYVSPTGNRDIDLILGDQLVYGFAKSDNYVAVERTQRFLTQLNKEHNYQRSGQVSDEQIKEIGSQLGVKYVCVAQTSKVFDSYFITSRIIDLTTNEIVNVYNAEGKSLATSKDVVTVASEIANHLSGRTIEEENEFQKNEQERIKREEQARKAQLRAEEEQQQKVEMINRGLEAGAKLFEALSIGTDVIMQAKKTQKTTYTLYIINNFSNPRLLYVDNYFIGEIPAHYKKNMEVPLSLYKEITLVQKSGYLLYPTKHQFTKKTPPEPGMVYTIELK